MKKYYCKICKFSTLLKYTFKGHLQGKKHVEKCCSLKNDNADSYLVDVYVCDKCNKEFYNKSSHWKHIKICENNDIGQIITSDIISRVKAPENNITEADNVVHLLLKQIAEQNKNMATAME